MHVSAIHSPEGDSGYIVMAGKTLDQHRVPFESHIDLLWLLDHLIRERVPFGVGGMSPRPVRRRCPTDRKRRTFRSVHRAVVVGTAALDTA